MNKKQLAEMIKHLRRQRKMKMEQLGGSGKFNPVHSPDPYQPKGDTPNAYAHRKSSVAEGIGPTHAASLKKRAGVISKMPSDRKRFQGGNQKRYVGSYTIEAEEDMGPTKTGQKGKRQEKINLNPEQKDNIV